MKFEIEINGDQWREMCKNKWAHNDVLTKDYMLDLLHNIVDQMHDQS